MIVKLGLTALCGRTSIRQETMQVRVHPAKFIRTRVISAHTDSSPAPPTSAATRSPPSDCNTSCYSLTLTTSSCASDWLNSPTQITHKPSRLRTAARAYQAPSTNSPWPRDPRTNPGEHLISVTVTLAQANTRRCLRGC